MDCVGYLYVHNFFLAEAVRKRPELAERSFWIDLNGRVLAASADLALLGIRMGTPARQARRTAPGAECVKYLPEDFQPMSDLFCDIAYKFTPVVAPLRPGEVFVGLQDHNCRGIAQALVAEVRDLGFEGVVAVAQSRLASRLLGRRMASLSAQAPDQSFGNKIPETPANKIPETPATPAMARASSPSFARLLPDNHPAFMAPHPVELLWTIPKKLRDRLGRLGILKVADLQRFHRSELRSRFGEPGLEIFEAGRGLDYLPIRAAWPPAAIFVSEAWDGFENREIIYEHLSHLTGRLSARLSERHKQCRRLRIEIQQEGMFAPTSERMVMNPPASGPNRLYLAARRMFDRMPLRRALESVVITAEDLSVTAPRQLDLFTPLRALAGQREEVKAFLTMRFGTETMRHGSDAPLSWRERMLEFYETPEP